MPIHEDVAMKPESLYGAGKAASEAYIRAFSNLYKIKTWIIRLSNTVGQRSTHGIIFDFLKKLQENDNELIVLGDGKQSKPYMYIDELIDTILFVIENSNQQINTFNIGPEDKISVEDIAKLTIEMFGNDQKISYTGGAFGWDGDIPIYSQNTEKIKALGWKSRFNSREAILESLKSIKERS